jgi:regulatory protein
LKSKNSEPSSPERAWQYALRLLAARDYTVSRIKEKLRAREFSETDLNEAIVRLEAECWISDRRYAERFAESALSSGRCFGPRLKLEMRKRGIPEDLAVEVIGRLSEEYDECREVRSVLERRFPGFSFAAAGDKEKRRAFGFLQRRGFGPSAIMRVMKDEDRC